MASPDQAVTGDSLKIQSRSVTGDSIKSAIFPFATATVDTIGDEEERDSWESYEYNENLPWWLEMDSGRETDPLDPREREQERDSRE